MVPMMTIDDGALTKHVHQQRIPLHLLQCTSTHNCQQSSWRVTRARPCLPGRSVFRRYEGKLMPFLELVATCFEQICHHPAGKTATRNADAFKGED